MSIINIYDVYGFLKTAKFKQNLYPIESSGFPVGGIHYLLRHLISDLMERESVVCCFDGQGSEKSFGRVEGYKANRKKDAWVLVQADFLFDFLRQCGIPCYRGYGEADDHIFSFIEANKSLLNKGIKMRIHASDWDLVHNVDERGVSYYTCNSNTSNVCYSNYSEEVGLCDEPIMFNTVTAYKVFCGDRSDNVGTFTSENGIKGIDLYRSYKNALNATGTYISGAVSRSRELLEHFVSRINLTENDLIKLNKRMDTFFPRNLISKVGEYKYVYKEEVDLLKLFKYCLALRDFNCVKIIKNNYKFSVADDDEDISDYKAKLYDLGLEYKNGTYQSDRNIKFNQNERFGEIFDAKGV